MDPNQSPTVVVRVFRADRDELRAAKTHPRETIADVVRRLLEATHV